VSADRGSIKLKGISR